MSNNANNFRYHNGLEYIYKVYDILPREARDYLKECFIPCFTINYLYELYANNRIDKKGLLEALVKEHEEYEKERRQHETSILKWKNMRVF